MAGASWWACCRCGWRIRWARMERAGIFLVLLRRVPAAAAAGASSAIEFDPVGSALNTVHALRPCDLVMQLAGLHAHEATRAEPDPRLDMQLEGFEGPLDLLLDLARAQKVDLAQISILSPGGAVPGRSWRARAGCGWSWRRTGW